MGGFNNNALQGTVKQTGEKADKVSTHIVNLTDREAVEALPDQVIMVHGAVAGIINNAGIIQPFRERLQADE